jgi:hypothetical protein
MPSRRSFFAALFAPILAKLTPKPRLWDYPIAGSFPYQSKPEENIAELLRDAGHSLEVGEVVVAGRNTYMLVERCYRLDNTAYCHFERVWLGEGTTVGLEEATALWNSAILPGGLHRAQCLGMGRHSNRGLTDV